MTKRLPPKNWAIKITQVLNVILGDERFPVNVESVAREYSQQVFPEDPISLVKGDNLPGFDGALFPAPANRKGWGIFYNTGISSLGRINFTLAHEFGHYLIHRLDYPEGIQCSQQDMFNWGSEYGQVEQQANDFAVTLLMPFSDFSRQIRPKDKPTLEDIGVCATRYQVSLIAATLRWLQHTERRSVLVVSRDGFILWSRSSKRAFKTGAYFKTANMPPKPIPKEAISARENSLVGGNGFVSHSEGIWFNEPCEEDTILSDHYDFAISLLHLQNSAPRYDFAEEETEDSFDRMINRTPGSPWLD